jgi:hypothetical protein
MRNLKRRRHSPDRSEWVAARVAGLARFREIRIKSLGKAQRTEQENFDWACGMVVGVIVLVGFALFILTAMAAGH